MGYIWQKLWDIFIKTTVIFVKTMGYNGLKLWDIMCKNYGIYLKNIINLDKLWDMLG